VLQYLSLSILLEVSQKNLALEWVDWNQFKENPIDFIKSREQVFTVSEKNKKLYTFTDAITRNQNKGKLSNIHEADVNHYCLSHMSDLYSSRSTKHLAIVMENNMSNFMFTDRAAPISDGLGRFLLRARTGMIYTPQ
jgi:hypothetical protein